MFSTMMATISFGTSVGRDATTAGKRVRPMVLDRHRGSAARGQDRERDAERDGETHLIRAAKPEPTWVSRRVRESTKRSCVRRGNAGLASRKTGRKKDQQSTDPTAHPSKVEPLYQ
jgi:hypothetical protein